MGKRKKLESFNIGMVPVPPGAKRGKLTPKEATRWLRQDHDAYTWPGYPGTREAPATPGSTLRCPIRQ